MFSNRTYPGAERREGCRGTDVFLTAGSAFVRRRHREQIEKRSAMTLTVYDKQLIGEVERMFPDHHVGEVVERLIRMGVVDTVRCKILVVREYVNELVGRGTGKVDAMYMAAEKVLLLLRIRSQVHVLLQGGQSGLTCVGRSDTV